MYLSMGNFDGFGNIAAVAAGEGSREDNVKIDFLVSHPSGNNYCPADNITLFLSNTMAYALADSIASVRAERQTNAILAAGLTPSEDHVSA